MWLNIASAFLFGPSVPTNMWAHLQDSKRITPQNVVISISADCQDHEILIKFQNDYRGAGSKILSITSGGREVEGASLYLQNHSKGRHIDSAEIMYCDYEAGHPRADIVIRYAAAESSRMQLPSLSVFRLTGSGLTLESDNKVN